MARGRATPMDALRASRMARSEGASRPGQSQKWSALLSPTKPRDPARLHQSCASARAASLCRSPCAAYQSFLVGNARPAKQGMMTRMSSSAGNGPAPGR